MSAMNSEGAQALKEEFEKPYYKSLDKFVKQEYKTQSIYPPYEELFSAFQYTPLSKVKVLILGQDPYHEPGQAHGMSFSVKPGVHPPPSLVNIFKELQTDTGCYIPDNGYLIKWARQGVFLLNTLLTVRAHQPFSHRGRGWEQFTDAVIRVINKSENPLVCMLWGKPAGEKEILLSNPSHLVLKAPHPSPLSAYRGFFGCKHFSRCNAYLTEQGLSPIDWQIENLKS